MSVTRGQLISAEDFDQLFALAERKGVNFAQYETMPLWVDTIRKYIRPSDGRREKYAILRAELLNLSDEFLTRRMFPFVWVNGLMVGGQSVRLYSPSPFTVALKNMFNGVYDSAGDTVEIDFSVTTSASQFTLRPQIDLYVAGNFVPQSTSAQILFQEPSGTFGSVFYDHNRKVIEVSVAKRTHEAAQQNFVLRIQLSGISSYSVSTGNVELVEYPTLISTATGDILSRVEMQSVAYTAQNFITTEGSTHNIKRFECSLFPSVNPIASIGNLQTLTPHHPVNLFATRYVYDGAFPGQKIFPFKYAPTPYPPNTGTQSRYTGNAKWHFATPPYSSPSSANYNRVATWPTRKWDGTDYRPIAAQFPHTGETIDALRGGAIVSVTARRAPIKGTINKPSTSTSSPLNVELGINRNGEFVALRSIQIPSGRRAWTEWYDDNPLVVIDDAPLFLRCSEDVFVSAMFTPPVIGTTSTTQWPESFTADMYNEIENFLNTYGTN